MQRERPNPTHSRNRIRFPMSPRATRVRRNEDLFRQVNVHIASLEQGSVSLAQDGLLPLVCECAHTGCLTPIEVDPATFEQVLANPARFLVAPGHEDLEAEQVIEQRPGYLIVEKPDTCSRQRKAGGVSPPA